MFFISALALLIFSAVPVLAQTDKPVGKDAHAVAQSLEARYQHARTLKAVFYERYTDGSGGSSAESGTVYFSRPGRMRWDYESPEQKLFLVDGTNVWFYVPADRTASRAKLKESSDWRTPLALLTGKADLSKLCRSIQIAGPDAEKGSNPDKKPLPAGDTVLLCVPSNAPPTDKSSQILFETDADSKLVRVLIRDAGRVETEFRFGNWEQNIAIPEGEFHFEPPSGVAIVDEESLAGEIH